MGRWPAVTVRLTHRRAAARSNIAGWKKKWEKCPDQDSKKPLRVFHVLSSLKNDYPAMCPHVLQSDPEGERMKSNGNHQVNVL
jgi:hypothetical protein